MKDYSKTKTMIEKKLNDMELEDVKELIKEYETEAPYDMDLITYKSLYHLYNNEIDAALQYALQGVRQYPTNGDMNYNLACIYEQKNDLLAACRHYAKAQYIYGYIGDEKKDTLCIDGKLKSIWDNVNNMVDDEVRNGNYAFVQQVDASLARFETFYGLDEKAFRDNKQIIGDYYYISDDEKKYIGLYRFDFTRFVGDGNWDLIHNKGEFLTVTEGDDFMVDGDSSEYLLPIAVKEDNTPHRFFQDGTRHLVLQSQSKHFNYYRVKQGTRVSSDGVSYYGKLIPLGHDPKRKKLVLNIFVDGLSQEILNGDDFKELMPYTYDFFSKGAICTKTYSTGEWTYPSLANIVTGLDTVRHMMFHDKIDGELPKDVPTIAEYFKEAGYYTAHLTGNWRIIPPYGHARGYDRYIYQHPLAGSKAEVMMADTIEQLEGFKDVDQFVTICMEDLHDVADKADLPIGVQSRMEISERIVEKSAATSVKQGGSANKVAAYKKMAQHIDVLLNAIYNYINNTYSEDEFIVSLFADHGQGYLIPEGGHFLSKERAKVAFMFRGGVVPSTISNEIMSAGDYISIMCRLAGIQMKNVETMSNLPVCFGGEHEREYAMMESIHPKDPYRAAFYAVDHTAYFRNGSPTGEDGRFELKDYKLVVEDMDGNAIEDKEKYDKYMNIVMEHIAPLIIY